MQYLDLFLEFLPLLFETIYIALAGVCMGLLLAMPLGYLGSRFNTNRVSRFVFWVFINCLRGVPAIIYAVILVKIIGLGTTTGIVAVALYSAGMLSKQLRDVYNSEDLVAALDIATATGQGRIKTFVARVLPTTYSQLLEFVFHRFEINIRTASLLGFVGAGGIGRLFHDAFTYFNFTSLIVYTALLALSLISIEAMANALRARYKSLTHAPSMKFRALKLHWLYWMATLATLQVLMVPLRGEYIWRQVNLIAIQSFMTPDFAKVAGAISAGIGTSIFIAVLATAIGALFAIPAGLFAAKIRWITTVGTNVARYSLNAIRSVPDLIFVLIFVVFLGLGDWPVILALAIGTIGLLGRFIASTAEETPTAIVDFAKEANLTKAQTLFSVVGQRNLTAIKVHIFHTLDINLRIAISLGVFGLGGIGLLLQKALGVYDFGVVSAVVLAIILTVNLVERVGKFVSMNQLKRN